YRHFKGMIVDVVGGAFHSETMEKMVVYRHDDSVKGKEGGTLWVRPLGMFLEMVEKDDKMVSRFEYIG
ncbi:MAG TPA: DUF1653 domain-containing protein, partial [Candidatus Moranbacteria bacterium]|nr:DUF1653 domain-containing protein [Candidatus Moranbacteria bacterium]